MPDRTRARELAAQYIAKGEPTAWFEALYREAESGASSIPWADLRPNPSLLEFWEQRIIPAKGRRALKVGCGFGDDAEQLAGWGFETTAFDISESAIRVCKSRFPGSDVEYRAADLLAPPKEWLGRFDFVLECYTLQVLPQSLRGQAIGKLVDLVRDGGYLLLIARGREEADPKGDMPWPLTRAELESISGLRILSFEDYVDQESPPVRRFRVWYEKGR
jgi:SAM-dependent methyltransferase